MASVRKLRRGHYNRLDDRLPIDPAHGRYGVVADLAGGAGRVGESSSAGSHRVSAGGEPRAQGATLWAPAAANGRAAPPAGEPGPYAGTSSLGAGGDARDAGYDSAVAPPADRAEMDYDPTRPGVLAEIRQLTVRMARENSHMGLPADSGRAEEPRPSRGSIHDRWALARPRHQPRAPAADVMAEVSRGALGRDCRRRLFATEVWTARGLVTYDTLFVIELASRRVHLVGSTPHPDDAFVVQIARTLTHADDGVLVGHRFLICDRDAKWSEACRQTLAAPGLRVVQTPYHAPDCNAYAERFVRAIKEECLDRLVILGEAHLRQALGAFTTHYHQERNHQGLHDRLIAPAPMGPSDGTIRCRPRLGGLLRYYYRAA